MSLLCVTNDKLGSMWPYCRYSYRHEVAVTECTLCFYEIFCSTVACLTMSGEDYFVVIKLTSK